MVKKKVTAKTTETTETKIAKAIETEIANAAKKVATPKVEYIPSAQEQYFADNNTGVTAEINANTQAINEAQANEDYWAANGQR